MLSLAQFTTTYKIQGCLMQYSFLEEYLENRDFAMNWPAKLITTSEREERLKRAERRIYGVCKGLLELREPYAQTTYPNMLGDSVRFIHRSITEFLESQTFRLRMDLESPSFNPFDALCQTYLGQLKRIRLPTAYFSPKFSSTTCIFPFYGKIPPEINLFYSPPHPTFREDILWIMCHQLSLDRHRALPGFGQFIKGVYHVVADLKVRLCVLQLRLPLGRVYCTPETVVLIFCIGLRTFEFLPLGVDADSQLMDLCASSCLFSFGWYPYLGQGSMHSIGELLQTLFRRGASPDSKLGAISGPAFHELLAIWCMGKIKDRKSMLAIISLMLYHGANPRFALVVGRRIYIDRDDKTPILYLKVHFKSETPHLEPGKEPETTRLARMHNPVLAISQRTTGIIKDHGHVIDLRALVSIWFPDHSCILQQVIDYIQELGVPVQENHRIELQTRFGPRLRPLFDLDHPEFFASDDDPKIDWSVSMRRAHTPGSNKGPDWVPVGRLSEDAAILLDWGFCYR
ncbi:hypothetical protein K445DRAFT_98866 [Daldinia sp. EC12]|nr:hypothetical protein K445DRAFT_98866 [Daldinia sp. EC12]